MTRSRVLVVDDDEGIRCVLRDLLSRTGLHDVSIANGPEEALEALRQGKPDVLITDVHMPGGGGASILERAGELVEGVAVIVISGQGTLRDFAGFLRLGACDYLLKPVAEADLLRAVARAIELKRLRTENTHLRATLGSAAGESILGDSSAMRAVREQVSRVASSDATVMISGASGTGKELVARAIHDASPRAAGPFLVVSCGALAETLLESELFGHVRGAFTGAEADRAGCFETANGGTLFLDEVGSMSAALQVRLLRVLAMREVTRVGDRRTRSVDVRIVASTNVALDGLVESGRLRADLYYRLNVVAIRLPPLADRGEGDIRLLATHACIVACHRYGRPPMHLTEAAMKKLVTHSWPGNVRELENAVGRAVILAAEGAPIDAADVNFRSMPRQESARAQLPEEGLDLEAHLHELERGLIRQALRRTGGNRQQAARLLRIQRTALVQKLIRLGMAESEAQE